MSASARSLSLALLMFFLPLAMTSAHAEDGGLLGTGLKSVIAVDALGDAGTDGTTHPSQFVLREAEFGFSAPADHLFDGALLFAAHREGGESLAEIHEAYLGSSRLIPNSRIKLGFFFLGFGRLNQFHRHDWPFPTAPLVQERLFAEEAATDAGLEYSYLPAFLPFYLELTAGITNGWTFGHAHGVGERPLIPTHYLRLATYQGTSDTGGLQFGLNYVGRKTESTGLVSHLGLDIVGKWRELQFLRWLFQSELWFRNISPTTGATEQDLGGYAYLQRGLGAGWSIGMRLDGFGVLRSGSFDFTLLPLVSWQPSEFVNFRTTFGADFNYSGSTVAATQQYLTFQTVFILGTHPAHDF